MVEHLIYSKILRHMKIQRKTQARRTYSFNMGWIFTSKEHGRPIEMNYDDKAWRDVLLPHDYSVEHDFNKENLSGASGGYVKTGILWYRKKFIADKADSGRKIFLNFDGISANSEIWLNETLIAQHPSGYSPIHIDVTRKIKFGEENILAVKADTSLQPYSRFYQGTGIYRNVEMIITDPLHIQNFGVTHKWLGNTLCVDTTVCVAEYPETLWYDFGKKKTVEIRKNTELITTLLDENGNAVAETREKSEIAEFTSHRFTGKLIINNPELWSESSPSMYYIRSALMIDDVIIDDVITPIGLREITYSARGLFINGKSVKLKGVCLHQDCGIFGASVPLKAWIKKLCLLKEMGANAVRTSHHPFMQDFYDICDILGLFVMDESFDEWRKGWQRDYSENTYGKNTYGYHQYFDAWSEIDTRLMVKRDRNHPSIIMWSMGNEIPDFYYEEGVKTLKKLVDFCKDEDKTRPVTIGAEGNYRLTIADGIMDSLDIAGYNYINLKNSNYFLDIHEKNPKWVFISSETFYEPEHWEFIKKHDYTIGQFLWSGYDYLGESCSNNPIHDMSIDFSESHSSDDQNFGGIGSANGSANFIHGWSSGMIDIIDNPKGQYYYHQSLWQTAPVIHIAAEMYEWKNKLWWQLIPTLDIWDFNVGEVKNVYCCTNCQKFDLLLNGRSLGIYEKKEDDIYPVVIPVGFERGELRAVGYIGEKIAASHSLYSAEAAAKIQLTCDYNKILAGGKDISCVTIRITDNNGHLVYNDNKEISVSIIGDGEVFRTGNGSLTNLQSYSRTTTKTFNGSAMAVIKANEKGVITVVARIRGLEEATIAIMAI